MTTAIPPYRIVRHCFLISKEEDEKKKKKGENRWVWVTMCHLRGGCRINMNPEGFSRLRLAEEGT